MSARYQRYEACSSFGRRRSGCVRGSAIVQACASTAHIMPVLKLNSVATRCTAKPRCYAISGSRARGRGAGDALGLRRQRGSVGAAWVRHVPASRSSSGFERGAIHEFYVKLIQLRQRPNRIRAVFAADLWSIEVASDNPLRAKASHLRSVVDVDRDAKRSSAAPSAMARPLWRDCALSFSATQMQLNRALTARLAHGPCDRGSRNVVQMPATHVDYVGGAADVRMSSAVLSCDAGTPSLLPGRGAWSVAARIASTHHESSRHWH